MFAFNSLTTRKQRTNFSFANFQKVLNSSCIILRIQRLRANSVDLDEVARFEPPHQDLRCLQIQIQLISSLVLKQLTYYLILELLGGMQTNTNTSFNF